MDYSYTLTQREQQAWTYCRRSDTDTTVVAADTRYDSGHQNRAATYKTKSKNTDLDMDMYRQSGASATDYDYSESTCTNEQLTTTTTTMTPEAAAAAAESAGRVLGFTLRIKNGKVRRCIACKVCGDDATGYNFGAIVCESCKSFYRRHVHRRTNFRCSGYGKCQLNHHTRRYCAACRLRQCFEVGMRRPSTFEVTEMQVSQGVWTAERRSRRNLLMKRLVQRITAKDSNTENATASNSLHSTQQTTKSNRNNSTLSSEQHKGLVTSTSRSERHFNAFQSVELDSGECEYEVLYKRISAAAKTITDWTVAGGASCRRVDEARARARAKAAACKSTSSRRQVSTIWLALGNYIEALDHFDELTLVGQTELERVFSQRVLDQINLYSLFTVNADESGWAACDTLGERCEPHFVQFVECLTRDGVSAHVYTLMFLELVHSLRANFQQDWPLVLLTLCLINLYSSVSASQLPSTSMSTSTSTSRLTWLASDACEVTRMRHRYERFLECYLRRNSGADYKSRLEYCTQSFPNALSKLVQNQRDMLAQLLRRSSAAGCNGDVVGTFVEPIVSLLVTHYTKC